MFQWLFISYIQLLMVFLQKHLIFVSMSYEQKSLSRVRLFVTPWNSLGQNTGVGSLSFLQGIFPTQRSNPGLPHCRRIIYQLNYQSILLYFKVFLS